MSIPSTVFPFVVSAPVRERFDRSEVALASKAESGKQFRRVKVAWSRFVGRYDIVFPQPEPNGLTARDLLDFEEARSGPVDTFLFKPKEYDHYHVVEEFDGDGTTSDFLLKYLHIDDDSIEAWIDSSTTSVTLTGNDTAPSVSALSPIPDSGEVLRVEYDIYVPGFLEEPVLDHDLIVPGRTNAHRGAKRYGIVIGETDHGARYSPYYRSLSE
ncbi:MAG TPA: hypothetical protein VJP77_05570 [Planctomycetota bacterium]|nr:hypothetical protein [Planctomycetota bacterium]